MKLCFSTLSCPDWDIGEIFSVAADLGYEGIEIRGIADELYAPDIEALSKEKYPVYKQKLERAGIEIPIITSGAYLCGNPDPESAENEVRDYVRLASRLGVKYVRVLGEKEPGPSSEKVDLNDLLKRYTSLCDFAIGFDVGILIETNGILADTKKMREFMLQAERDNGGVVWDIHHPYRYYGELPDETISNISEFIRHVHVKDSVKGTNGIITYMLTGYGDVPVAECVRLLKDTGFDGHISYEWVKRWSRELAEPAIALYQYIEYMRGLV